MKALQICGATLCLIVVLTHGSARSQEVQDATLDAATFERQWKELRALRADPKRALKEEEAAELKNIAVQSSAWMLRALAVQILAQRSQTYVAARAGFDDSYSRVRAAAAQSLSGDPNALPDIEKLAVNDVSSLVRASAIGALAAAGTEQAALSGLHDPSASVRVASVIALSNSQAHQSYMSNLIDVLRSSKEQNNVRAAAATALGRMCAAEAQNALTKTLDETAARANSESDDKDLYRDAWTALYRIAPDQALKKVPAQLAQTRAFQRALPQTCAAHAAP